MIFYSDVYKILGFPQYFWSFGSTHLTWRGQTYDFRASSDVSVSVQYGSSAFLTGDGNDLFHLTYGTHTVVSNGGHDTVYTGNGNVHFFGGNGHDKVSFDGSTLGVSVNLFTETYTRGRFEGTLNSVEAVVGSRHADFIRGSNENNELFGNDGDDVLIGMGGRDMLSGGGGSNMLFGGSEDDYFFFTDSFIRNGRKDYPYHIDWSNEGDHAFGGTGNDVFYLYDQDRNHYHKHRDGTPWNTDNDTVSGEQGNDYAFAEASQDHFDGGANIDTLDYREFLPEDVNGPRGFNNLGLLIDVAVGETESLRNARFFDTFEDVEIFRATNWDDTLVGSGQSEALVGRGGNDVLYGGDAFGQPDSDMINAGAGHDTVVARGTGDLIVLGTGSDLITFAESSNSAGLADIVFDFNAFEDRIVIDTQGEDLQIEREVPFDRSMLDPAHWEGLQLASFVQTLDLPERGGGATMTRITLGDAELWLAENRFFTPGETAPDIIVF